MLEQITILFKAFDLNGGASGGKATAIFMLLLFHFLHHSLYLFCLFHVRTAWDGDECHLVSVSVPNGCCNIYIIENPSE